MIDLHIHSNLSDGTDTVEELLKKLLEKGIKTFSITDHDNIVASKEIEKYQKFIDDNQLTYITGVEFSTDCRGQKMHVLAYGYSNEPDVQELVEEVKKLRFERVEQRVKNLKEKHNIVLTNEELQELWSYNNPSKPHIANILVRRNLAKDVQEAISLYLNEKFSSKKLQAEYVVEKLSNAGVCVGIAHPLGGEGEKRISPEQFEENVSILKDKGIKFVECYYCLYNEEERNIIKQIAKKHNLALSGGSDYHGKNKTVELGNLGKDYVPKKEDFTVLKLL